MNADFLLRILLLIGLGVAGAWIAIKLRVPTGVFLGPILLVSVFQISFGPIIEKPSWLRLIVQIAVGLVLGTGVTKTYLKSFRKLIKPTIMVCASLICGSVLLALLIHAASGWDLSTCILATAPGGQAEIAMLSDSVGAETEKVITLQLIRNQLVIIVMLPLARYFIKHYGRDEV